MTHQAGQDSSAPTGTVGLWIAGWGDVLILHTSCSIWKQASGMAGSGYSRVQGSEADIWSISKLALEERVCLLTLSRGVPGPPWDS